jgi:hypothetical protein
MDVRLPDGTVIQNVPDGTTKAQLVEKLKANGYDTSKLEVPEAPKVETAEKPHVLDRIARQTGLTGRYLIEGTAATVGLVSDPIAAVMNKTLGTNASSAAEVGRSVADTIGLPTPENATERVVGDASRMLAGTGGIVKVAGNAAGAVASPVAREVLRATAAAPEYQAISSVAAGASGGAARESGASGGGQFVAALMGGVAAPAAAYTAKNSAQIIKNFLSKPKPQQIDAAINQAGIDLAGVSDDVARMIRKDVEAALQSGQNLSPDALRRLADYRAVGATPTRGSLTLNPADVTRDRNLAKVSANSNDPAAQQLANVANENNKTLISRLNTMGAETADDAVTAGGKVMGALEARDQAAKGVINELYTKARATDGRSAQIDPSAFTQRANNLLDESLLGGKLPSDVRNRLNSIAKGETPLTVDVAEQFKTSIAGLQRASKDPAERLALGQVRQALDDAPLLEGQGQAAIDAFTKARKVNAAYMKMVERTPALKAVREGIEPDKFVQTFIVGNGGKTNIRDLDALKKAVSKNPEALQTIKDQIILHLKGRAVNNAADDVANFSPASYNKALKDIGDMKLSLFFDKSEVDALKQIGRVASYEKFQPAGSAVNNSNTAATAIGGLLDMVANSKLLRMVPLGSEVVANPVKNVSSAVGARNALDAAKAVRSTAQQKEPLMLPLSAVLASGSLGSE